jgi:hypothetical protein
MANVGDKVIIKDESYSLVLDSATGKFIHPGAQGGYHKNHHLTIVAVGLNIPGYVSGRILAFAYELDTLVYDSTDKRFLFTRASTLSVCGNYCFHCGKMLD